MPDSEKFIPAFLTQEGFPEGDIDSLLNFVETNRPEFPRMRINEGGLDANGALITSTGDFVFAAIDRVDHTAKIAYTKGAKGFVEGGAAYVGRIAPVRGETIFNSSRLVRVSAIDAIHSAVDAQTPTGLTLPGWTAEGHVLTARIRQVSPQGGTFISVVNRQEPTGSILFSATAAPLVEGVIGRR